MVLNKALISPVVSKATVVLSPEIISIIQEMCSLVQPPGRCIHQEERNEKSELSSGITRFWPGQNQAYFQILSGGINRGSCPYTACLSIYVFYPYHAVSEEVTLTTVLGPSNTQSGFFQLCGVSTPLHSPVCFGFSLKVVGLLRRIFLFLFLFFPSPALYFLFAVLRSFSHLQRLVSHNGVFLSEC